MIEEANAPEQIGRIVGELPEAGRILDPDSYPFETVRPTSDGFVERDGVRTYYAVWGEQGPVHCLGSHLPGRAHGHVKATVPYLCRYFRVVTIDLRGNGRSDRPADPAAYSFDHFYADLLAVLDHLQIERLAIIGVSCAAMPAIRLAAEQPERVSHLINVGGEFEWDALTLDAPHTWSGMRGDYKSHIDVFSRQAVSRAALYETVRRRCALRLGYHRRDTGLCNRALGRQ